MVVVKLMGGLGNQMFQYAAGKYLSMTNQCPLLLDLSFLLERENRPADFVFRDYDLDIFKLSVDFASISEVNKLKQWHSNKKINKLFRLLLGARPSYFKEPHFHFDSSLLTRKPPVYLDGYWQSEKYFKPIEQQIKKDFEFKSPVEEASLQLANEILQNKSVCVNIRRGDFVTSSTHGTTNLDYYKKAESELLKIIDDPIYNVFSDDIEWCMENIKFNAPTKYISHEHAGNKFGNYLQLMSFCKHFIIPNSSFGWWAAWLSNHPGKIVIAPKKWFNDGPQDTFDLLPEEWIKI